MVTRQLDDATAADFNPSILAGAGNHAEPIVYHSKVGYQGTLLVYTRAGGAFFQSERQTFMSRPHDLVLVRPKAATYGPAGPSYRWQTFWTEFDPRANWIAWLNWPVVVPGVSCLHLRNAKARRDILAQFAKLIRVMARPRPFREEFAENALAALLLHCRVINRLEQRAPVDARVQLVSAYLSKHYDRALSLPSLAKMVHLSPSHLEEIFKNHMGISLSRFHDIQRMRRAANLIGRTTMPIKEIAAQLGFQDPLYFSRRFRKSIGHSPMEYRRRNHLLASRDNGGRDDVNP